MDPVISLLNQWGPPGIIAVIMWIMLKKSEDREAKKDTRIQLLENQLMESYGERIEAADQVAEAIHANSTALIALTNEVRSI